MSLAKLFKTNPAMERDGILVDYGPNEELPLVDGAHPQMRFKIARAGGANQAHNKAVERLIKPHKRTVQTGNLSNELAKSIDRAAWMETCLLGWENISLEGEVLDFSKENAERLFNALPDLYADLREQSNNMALFREEVLEADLGNSGRSLSTDSSKDR